MFELETTMHVPRGQPHYAPASVGVLIEPEFLRGTMIDANGERRLESAAPAPKSRWKEAMQAISAVFRR